VLSGRDEAFTAIANDGFENNLDPQLIQPFGEIKGIGVLAEWGQQFRTDRDDLSIHG
jgi:hypothetical protein